MDWAQLMAEFPAPATVKVEALAGASGRGDVYAPPVDVGPCIVEHERRRVRVQTSDAAGKVVISSTTVYAPPGTVAPPDSRVTLPNGATSKVLVAIEQTAAGLPLPEHVELALE